MPAFYKHYVDDTLSTMFDVSSASEFLLTLSEMHGSLIQFHNGTWRQRQTSLSWNGDYQKWSQIDVKVYEKPTYTGLLLHYQSHVDVKYKITLSTVDNAKPCIQTLPELAVPPSRTWTS